MSATLGVGIIGAGRAGLLHARNFARRLPHAKLVGVADPEPAARANFRREFGPLGEYSDPRQLLADPNLHAVVITAPTSLHAPLALSAAAQGKHLFCEKPMARTVAECESMIAAARQAQVVLQIGFMRRFDKGFRGAWERIRSGEIGRVVQVKSLTHGPSVPRPWMYDLKVSNGPLAEVNSHDIDTLRWFTGSEFKEVYALAGNYRCPQARASHPEFYDNVILVASFENGMQGLLCGAQGVGYGYDARCEILGEKGLVLAGSLRAQGSATCLAGGIQVPAVRSWTELFEEAYLAEDQAFVECIREGRAPAVSGSDGMEAVRVVEAGNRSIASGRPVRLREDPD